MNITEFVQMVKKMFSKGLTPSEKIRMADEKPMHRFLLKQWDRFWGTSIEDKKTEEEIWTHITDVCWTHGEIKKKSKNYSYKLGLCIASACLVLVVGTWMLFNYKSSYDTITIGPVTERMSYTLPDSSVVWLSVGSALSYQENFLEDRKVSLKGEASFDVRKMMSAAPFLVDFKDASVEVKGTEFNIKSDDMIAEVTLFTGKIDLKIVGQKMIEVKPSQRIIYNLVTKKVESETLDIEGYNWRTEEYAFKDKPLGELINFINKTYHTAVCFENTRNRDNLFTGTIHKDEELEKVLRKICISFELKLKQQNDTIVLY